MTFSPPWKQPAPVTQTLPGQTIIVPEAKGPAWLHNAPPPSFTPKANVLGRTGKIPLDPNSMSSLRLADRTLDKMRDTTKTRRDVFVQEYLVDFNATQAALRSGFPYKSCGKAGSEMLREPYVAQQIKHYIDAQEEANLINRNRVIAGLVREANWYGPDSSHGARVAALSKLAKILGMEIDKTEVKISGGIMLVPLAASLDDWEQKAITSQGQLKSDVRT